MGRVMVRVVIAVLSSDMVVLSSYESPRFRLGLRQWLGLY